MQHRAIQDQFRRNNYCWGCGQSNDHGLKIRRFWLGDEAVCTWQPEEYQAGGPQNVVNGAIVATLIDCHSACTTMAAAYQSEDREIGSEPHIRCGTAHLEATYLQPTPLGEPVSLQARVKEMGERKIIVSCSVTAQRRAVRTGEGRRRASPARVGPG